MTEKISNIVVHCSDSSWGSAAEIRKWHLENGWRDIGYHFVILNGRVKHDFCIDSMDGSVEVGRGMNGDDYLTKLEIGAHALGYNSNSIGICMIGRNDFSAAQFGSLIKLLVELKDHYGIETENIFGHCETLSGKLHGKTCPNFNISLIRNILNRSKS